MDPATIDAIILHKSAAETMDTNWLKATYARGVVVAGLNLNGQELGQLVGDDCVSRDGFATFDPGYNHYVVLTFESQAANSADQLRLLDNFSRHCGQQPTQGITQHASLGFSRSADVILNEDNYHAFTHIIAVGIKSL